MNVFDTASQPTGCISARITEQQVCRVAMTAPASLMPSHSRHLSRNDNINENHPANNANYQQDERVQIVSCSLNALKIYSVCYCFQCGHKLIKEYETTVYGDISSIGLIKIGNNLCLIMLCQPSKLSIVFYDCTISEFRTVYLYDFQELISDHLYSVNNKISNSLLCNDQKYSMNAINIYDSFLCIIGSEAGNRSITNHAYDLIIQKKISWKEINCEIVSIRDMKFLSSHVESSIIVMYEKNRTWDGSSPGNFESIAFLVISVNLVNDSYSVIWNIEKIPYDALYMVAALRPLSGCALVCRNSFHYFSQSSSGQNLSLNSCVNSTLYKKLKGMKFSLQRSSSFFITPNDLISIDSNGHVYHFMFEMDSGNYVSNIVVKECDEVIPSYFAIHCMKDLVFIGGYENGSCLYSFKMNSKRDIKITLLDKINILNFSSNSVASVVKYGSKMLQTIYNVEQINSKSSLVTSCTTEAFVEEINTLKLKEFQTFWPLYGYQSDENIDVANKGLCDKNLQYSYVILTNDSNSMIIKAKTGFSILTKTKFCTDKPTILAGNIGKNNYILQVLNNSIGLFRDTKELQNISISENILNVKINQSVICALCKPNTVLSFSLNSKTEQLFEISKIILDVEIVDFSLGFLDKFMNSSFVDFYEAVDENNKPETSSLDIEEYLYGAPVFKKPKQANKILSQSESNKIRNLEHKKTFAFLLAEGSKLIIYDIENSKKIFESEGIDFLINTLENGFKEEKLLDLISTQTQRNPANTIEVIQYGHNYSKLDLLITNNSDVILYEGVKLKGSGQINLRFKRKKIVMPFSKIRKLIDISEIKDGEEKQYLVLGNENLTMIFFSERAEIASNLQVNLESHSCNDIIHIDRFINQINGANIGYLTSGGIFTMVYADIYESDHLNISDRYFFSSQVLNSKIESIVYHSASRSLFLINSEIHLTDELIKVHQETTEMEKYIVDDSFLLPDTKHFFISAIDCETFEEIPDSKIYFDLYDKFLDSKEASIIIGDDLYDVKNLLIVGTNTFHGEELPTRGHIHIYDIVEVNPEPDKPLTRRKLKHVLSEEQKGPLSAFCEIKGHICVALTNRIFLLSMHQNSKSLITVAFIDTLFYMNQITSFKNFLLCSDVLKSIYLLQMDSDKKVISLISRDVNNRSILASGFFPTGNTSLKSVDKEDQSRDLFLAASDFNGNVYIFSHYSRALVNIQDSQRMGLIGKFHNGSSVRNFIHLLAKENRIYSVLCDTDGSLTTLSVLNESQYRRLSMLQAGLMNYLPCFGGQNLKAFKSELNKTMAKTAKSEESKERLVIDFGFLQGYIYLNSVEQQIIAKKIGTSVLTLLSDLKSVNPLSV